MPSTVGATLARKMERARAELTRANRPALAKGANILAASARKNMPERLRGVGKKGAKIGARAKVESDRQASVSATGPVHLIERDTKAHTIGPKKKNAKKRSGQGGGRGGGVKLANGAVRRTVQHPGTKGKQVFEKGIETGTPGAMRALANAHTDAIKRGLSG